MLNHAKKILLFTGLFFLMSAAVSLQGRQASAEEIKETEAPLETETPKETETKTPLAVTDESLFVTEYIDGVLTVTDFRPPATGQNMTDIVVPAAVRGQKIRAVGTKAFAHAGTNIHNLYLPDTLEIIGEEAFSSYAIDRVASYTYTATGDFAQVETASAEQVFTNVPVVETDSVAEAECLPTQLTKIGYRAFYNSPVKNITFNSKNLVIGANAFENTGNLLEVVLMEGASIEELGEYAFLNSGIHNFTIDGSIGKVGASAFQGTANISGFIVNETGNVNELGAGVFENSGIHYVTIRGTVSSIGERAFAGCGNILDVTVQSSTPYTLGEFAFQNAGIHSVNFSDGLTEVEKGTFEGCGNLETVKLPDTLTDIAEDAFKNASNIKEITINENVKIAPTAFVNVGGSTLQALANTNNASAKALAGVAPAPTVPVVVTPAPVPVITPAPQITVSPVKLTKVKKNKKGNKVTLTWTKNKKASGYTIYKKVVKKGTKANKAKKIKFVKVKNVGKKTCKITLTLAKKSTTYFYVKAYEKTAADGGSTTVYSKVSNTKKATAK